MKTLWLLRHAKAASGADDQSDHERPLEARGRDDAEAAGRRLASCDARPERVLCSSALRARETFEALAGGLGVALDLDIERDLYLASPEEIVACLHALPDDVGSAMVVAHNPGIAQLANQLARTGEADDLAELRRRFPTCALAELRFDVARWRAIAGGGELTSFRTP